MRFMVYRLRARLATTCLIRLAAIACLALSAIHARAAELIDYPFQDVVIAVCKIDMRRDRLRMFWRDDNKAVLGYFQAVQQWLQRRGQSLVCATNAGIYEEDRRPLGLYVENGAVLRRLNLRKGAYGNFYSQPNGVFLVRDRDAAIIDTERFAVDAATLLPEVRFATQSGPLLIQHGLINAAFSPESTNRRIRNAVCTVSPYESALVLSRGPINFYDFARFLRERLDCTDALYLDGGISRMYPGPGADIGPAFGAIIGVVR